MEISKECVDIFSWQRVYRMHPDDMVAYVRRQRAKNKFFKPGSALQEDKVLKNALILDAGCGPGLKSCLLAAYGPKLVVGIDGSAPSIAVAESLASSLGQKNTQFINGYLENIPQLLKEVDIPEVDYVLCSQMIHHTTDWKKSLEVLHEVLRDGGILHLSWLDITSNWGAYMIKNKISYHLGRSKESRAKIGAFLFGWLDKPKKKLPIAWEAFYADRYAAFYKIITVGQMKKALKSIGFEVLESYPCIDWEEYRRQELQKPKSDQRAHILRYLQLPPFRPLFTFILRLRQFMGFGGDIRTIYCRKHITKH